MTEESKYPAISQLFTVRVWIDDGEEMQRKWRGKVQHMPTGAWRYFRDWEGLVLFFEAQFTDDSTAVE